MGIKINKTLFYITSIYIYLFLTPVVDAKEKSKVFINATTFNYSEMSPIKQLVDELRGPRVDEGEIAFTTSDLESGIKYKHFSIAAFARLYYYLEHTPDTALLFWQDRNDQPFDFDRTYDIDLYANHVRGNGIRFGFHNSFDLEIANINLKRKINYVVKYSRITGKKMVDGRLVGYLSRSSETPDNIEGELFLDYAYTEDKIFDRPENDIEGKGYSIDFGFDFKINERFHLNFFARDFISRITWKDQFVTYAEAGSDTISLEEDGTVDVSPAISWLETEETRHQIIPREFSLDIAYNAYGNHFLEYQLYTYAIKAFHRLGYRFQPYSHFYFSSSYDFTTSSTSVGIHSKFFVLSVMSDSTDYESSKTLGIDFSLMIPF